MRQCGRAQPEAGQPGEPAQSCSRSARSGGPVKTRASLTYSARRARPGAARARRRVWVSSRNTTRSPKTCTVCSARPATSSSPRISATISAAWPASRGVTNPTSAERAISRYGALAWPRAATTGWPCGGRGVIAGPFDREPAALEVDVVQLVPVDEAAGGHVADLRVVFPAVPETAQHLHLVGRLVEAVGDQPLHVRIRQAVQLQRRDPRRPKWAAVSARAPTWTRIPARPVLT